MEKILKMKWFVLVIHIWLSVRFLHMKQSKEYLLSLSMRYSNIDVLYVFTGLKKNRTRMLKSVSIFKKMHPDDTTVFASNIIDK